MEKTTEISLPFQISASIDQNSKILLNIDQLEYNLPIEILFDMAKRNNPKRKFLFVSKVLGKHIPIRPMILRLIGGILARLWYEKCYGTDALIGSVDIGTNILVDALIKIQSMTTATLEDGAAPESMPTSISESKSTSTVQFDPVAYSKIKASVDEVLKTPLMLPESTLFIGFAETATGIAQAVFSNFSNASYIHTTREKLDSLEPNFTFNEEHSHAVEHALYTLDKAFLTQFDRIVLIDDELTTGNTAINLMRNLPGSLFGLISILDWRNSEQLEKFNSLQDIDVTVCSLVKGTINELVEMPSMNNNTNINDNTMEDIKIDLTTDIKMNHKNIFIKDDDNLKGYLKATGRFGISDNTNEKIQASVKKVANLLKDSLTTGNCLCLGTEEFIYLPCRIAEELGNIELGYDCKDKTITNCDCTNSDNNNHENSNSNDHSHNHNNNNFNISSNDGYCYNNNIFFHSTTRSPIYAKLDTNYCIKNKVEFPSPSKNNVKNYIYNIPYDFYKQVYLFSEKPLNKDDIKLFNQIFNTFHIENITYVSWI